MSKEAVASDVDPGKPEPIFMPVDPRHIGPAKVVIPETVVELLQGEADLRNAAMQRWTGKLKAAAMLSDIDVDNATYEFQVGPDGVPFFLVTTPPTTPAS